MLKGIEFIRENSRGFKTLPRSLSSLRVKRSNDDRQGEVGRSMIEMLGVLAIIAVLSVGGIAGYAKAMREYYSSQQKYQYSQLFMNIITLREQIGAYPETYENITSLLNNLNMIPQGMTYKYNFLYDHYGNKMYLGHGLNKWNREDGSTAQEYYYLLGITFTLSQAKFTPGSYDACKNVLNVVNVMKDEVSGFTFHIKDNSTWNGNLDKSFKPQDLESTAKIHELCQQCNSTQEYCILNIVFKK